MDSISVLFRVVPWLYTFHTMATPRIGVAKQAIVITGLQAVRANIDRYFAAAAGLYPLAGVFFEGEAAGI